MNSKMEATVVVATNNAHKAREVRALLNGAALPEHGRPTPELGQSAPGRDQHAPGPARLILEVFSLGEAGVRASPEETGATFEENALIKARAAFDALYVAAGALGEPGALGAACASGEPGATARQAIADAARDRRLFVLADDSGLCVDFLGGAPGVRSARYAGESASDAERVDKLLEALHGEPRAKRGAHFICSAAVICPDGGVRMCEGRCGGSIIETPTGQGGFGYDPVFLVDGLGRTMAELSFDEKNRVSHRGAAIRAAASAIACWLQTSG